MDRRAKTYEQLLADLEMANEQCERLAAELAEARDSDFRSVFRGSPDILLLLTPDFRMVEASDARLNATSTTREDTLGRYLFDVFPDSADNEAAGQANLLASLTRVLETRQAHTMALQRYDLIQPDGTFEERYWRPTNLPVLGPDGEVRFIIHRVEDATPDVMLDAALAIRRSEKRLLERIIDHAPAGIAYLNKDLVYEWVNPTFAAATGLPPSRFVGSTIFEAFGNDTESQIGHLLRKALETGDPIHLEGFPFEYQVDGETRQSFWDFTYQPVREDDGQVVGILTMVLEVSDRIQRERLQADHMALLKSEKQRVEDLVLERTSELQAANEELSARSEALKAQQVLLENQAKALEEQKAFALNLIRHVPAAVAYLDRDLVFRVTNPTYDAMLGIPGDQLKDRYVFDVLPGTEAQVEPLLRGVLTSGKAFSFDNFPFVYQRDGREVTTYWDFIYHPLILDPRQGVQGILVLAHDSSKRVQEEEERERYRKQLQEQEMQALRLDSLEQADRGKDQFLGILSHELRTPINAIMGFSSVLADGLAGDLNPEQTKYIHKILDSSDDLLGLVNDLLDLSRVQAGKFALDMQTVEIGPLNRKAVSGLAAEAIQKGLSIVNDLPSDLPVVRADPQRVSQVLNNLVTNAIKYTPEGGSITVRARTDGPSLRVEVADTGLGVSKGQQARIFQAFTQVDMTSTRARGGVGLGLSIVKALVEAHGGTVGVESEGVGHGSTFFFTLPLAPP